MKQGDFIMGAEVKELEQILVEYTQSQHVITVSSGTDAL
jgi:dTDP-4-amino-4,6-dideoxygalactose transaminase